MVFQREPPHVLSKGNTPYSQTVIRAFAASPALCRTYRLQQKLSEEARYPAFTNPKGLFARTSVVRVQAYIASQVKDPSLRQKLMPQYGFGCKRVLLSDDYYKTFNRDNVRLVTEGVTAAQATGLVDTKGNTHEVDVVVYATGFDVKGYMTQVKVEGEGGKILAETWEAEDYKTYLGICTPGFPNLFVFYGPNTNLSHTTPLLLLEEQALYTASVIDALRREEIVSCEIKAQVAQQWASLMTEKIKGSSWTTGGCRNWYIDGKGRSNVLFPGHVWEYSRHTRVTDLSLYVLKKELKEEKDDKEKKKSFETIVLPTTTTKMGCLPFGGGGGSVGK